MIGRTRKSAKTRRQTVFTLEDLAALHELCIEARARTAPSPANSGDQWDRWVSPWYARIGSIMVDLKTLIDNDDYE